MENFNNFDELNSFVQNNYQNTADSFQVFIPSKKLIKETTNSLITVYRLNKRHLLKYMKEDLKFDRALNTMPHNWLWKLTHRKLWRKIKIYLEEQNTEEEIKEEKKEEIKEIKPLVPEVVKAYSFVPACEEEEDNFS